MKHNFKVFAAIYVLCVAVQAKDEKYEDRFKDYGVYKIQNRMYVGVLTFPKTPLLSVPPLTSEFDDSNPGQRWRMDESSLYTAFEFRPMSNENYVLEYRDKSGILRWIKSWGWGNNKLWYLQDAGDGFTLIKNKHNEVCLQSMGINASVSAKHCNGNFDQQWKLEYTS